MCVDVCAYMYVQVRRRERTGEREKTAVNLKTDVMGNATTHFSSTNKKVRGELSKKNLQY